MAIRRWQFCDIDRECVQRLREECGVTRLQAALLCNRSITEPEEVAAFFETDSELCFEEPFALADMEEGVAMIQEAIAEHTKICIFGDYDADGVTSTVVLYSYLSSVGAQVTWTLPQRDEGGYGMNNEIVDELHAQGVGLIITVDNGVSAQSEIAYAKSLGMKVLVTDHHTVVEPMPDCPVINPHRADCLSHFKGLCGVGVVFKLVSALCEDAGEVIARYGDLIALGTVADIVPLTGENRAIVQLGMPMLEDTQNLGLRALMKRAGVLGKVGSQSVVYGLAPRINAAGRMGDAGDVVRLLLCQGEAEADELAAKIDGYNTERQQVEQRICREAIEQYLENDEIRYAQIGVVSGENWHSGVNGIVASRLCERYNKPFVVFCEKGEEAVGSARSVDSFSIYDAVYSVRDILLRYGGHSQAAGMSIRPELIGEFRRRINEFADGFGCIEPNTLRIDGRLRLEDLNIDLTRQLAALEPFGRDNPAPLFQLQKVTVKNVRSLKSGEHCLLEVVSGGKTASLLLFGTPQRELVYRVGDSIDAVVGISSREYCGNPEISVIIKDIRRSGFDEDNYFNGRYAYERFRRTGEYAGERITRSDVALVYRYLREIPVYTGGDSELAHSFFGTLPFYKVLGCIDVLADLKILELTEGKILFVGAENKKMNLSDSPVYRKIGVTEN